MKKYVFGIDVGGTTVKLGLFTVDGELLDKWEIPTDTAENGEKILPDIAAAIKLKIIEKAINKSEIAGAGLGVPGPVDGKGNIKGAVNLGWGEFNVATKLEGLLDIPVKAGNDANVAGLGEQWKGAGEGCESMVMVTLGTGVGGSVIIDGRVLCGATGAGGEIGHIHVEDKETESCGCGNKGCLEQYSSATGIVRLAKRRIAALENGSDKDNPLYTGSSLINALRTDTLSAKTIFDAVKEKDLLAVEIANEFGSYLGKGLANVADVVNPEIIVIGGGVSKAGNVVLDYTEKYFKESVFHACRNTGFALAKLGNDAGIYGAAKLCL